MKRTHLLLALAGTAMLGGSAAPGHSSIFGRDDRQYVGIAAGSPYSSVGLVAQGLIMKSFTTGFLVDDCHVLTAQGVLGYGQAPFGKRLTFLTGLGTPRRQSTKATVVAAGGFRRNRTGEEQYERGGRDWLLLQLDQCIGAILGHVMLKTGPFSPYEFRDLRSAGYPAHRRRASGLTVDPSCNVIASKGTVWLNDCATVKGDAGDPIFRISTLGPRPQMEVYAMQSAGFEGGKPVSLTPGYENQAVPMSLIAPQIKRYLSAGSRVQTGLGVASQPKRANALHNVGGSAGASSHGRLLATRLVTAK